MAGVVAEAAELVEQGLVTPADFKRFMFSQPGRAARRDEPAVLRRDTSRATRASASDRQRGAGSLEAAGRAFGSRPKQFTGGITVFDLAITNGVVVDGTGEARRPADVGVRDGRIVAIAAPGATRRSRPVRPSTPTVSWWRPGSSTCTPISTRKSFGIRGSRPRALHGITTVIGGNCGFSIAPLGGDSDARLRHADAGPGRRYAARIAAARCAMGLAGHRWISGFGGAGSASAEHGVYGRTFDDAPRRYG